MNRLINLVIVAVSCWSMPSVANQEQDSLLQQYKLQHQALVPVVAVADIYFGCSIKTQNKQPDYSFHHMVTTLDRDFLADQASQCLDTLSIQSEQAVNYGLYGCFFSQMLHLAEDEQQANMQEVDRLIAALSIEEKQKSFSQCVSDQAVDFVEVKP